ncbi:3-deoxy-D-arabino-heptulosonate 7-phosphate synthase [Bordetella genomosp. 13]|uniref:3-deoxy-D-arabino-heptulosonate 7-phosphate synthase n=1 Tax=Bordetella genomosp. 13 TaxID=463040 RepID=A0A1W6Z7S0_9BORD|nr:3-deoxy-D-arabino-heptulosonate 7-phosphate synthase [Bordetella genomosp. 13]ARP93170.1 3-deoxy-D-arabino-heptulosonate 7-phosphate synthase [Bordetella genomosp. 13]
MSPLSSSHPLLDDTLRAVVRRYRPPSLDDVPAGAGSGNPAAALAILIERARRALARGDTPDAALMHGFTDALARLIDDALQPGSGDPVFQAMVLRHQVARVREYASLAAHADKDRRQVHAAVNAVAHPAKPARSGQGPVPQALESLHLAASSASWLAVESAARALFALPGADNDPALQRGVKRLLDGPELGRLQRLDRLASDEQVRLYQSLWSRHGPAPGSAGAVAQGAASQQRGDAVEAQATRALEALARRLNAASGATGPYRVVTSMRVPSSMPGNPERAKTEWDGVLLAQAGADVWDVCLLVEAKASVEAASTDFPRLMRGLRLLAQAEQDEIYAFPSRQGPVRLRGASLRALPADEGGVADTVLYCCDASADTMPRLLGSAARMQLLSAQASVAYASARVAQRDADPPQLEPVWHQLLASPQWRAVLHQYPTLCRVRELMVHVDDLLQAAAVGPQSRFSSP